MGGFLVQDVIALKNPECYKCPVVIIINLIFLGLKRYGFYVEFIKILFGSVFT